MQPAVVEAAPAMPPETAPAAADIGEAVAHFDFDSAELTAAGRAELDAWLARTPRGTQVVVTGHADRLGPVPYNVKLSQRRAETVRRYLVEREWDARDIQILAKGEAAPVKRCKGAASPATIACLAPNRRVEIDPE
ncbi:MAG: OmpA family protein [Thiobacillaceae bacterium]|nr:OmpA family protein [Thiobacillaceae bacterium]